MQLGIGMMNLSKYTSNQFPALDPTTPWYEFNSYCECCYSLGVTPSVGRFIAYNNYFKKYGIK